MHAATAGCHTHTHDATSSLCYREVIPAHYGAIKLSPRRRDSKRAKAEHWEGAMRLSWQNIMMCLLLLTSVYSWIIAHRVDGCRHSSLDKERLDHFAYPGDFHRSRPLAGAKPLHNDFRTSTRSLLLAKTDGTQGAAGGEGAKADTLVVYVYSPTDPEYENNLRYFLREGVHDHDGCDYVFVLQSVWVLFWVCRLSAILMK